jgi:transposase
MSAMRATRKYDDSTKGISQTFKSIVFGPAVPSIAKGPERTSVCGCGPIAAVARDGELRICYEASGAGYVLQRALKGWAYACDVIAPSLIPKRPGVQRKHDKRDASDLARLYRAGELTPVRIPSEAEERVRDVVRCRETSQREILESRHYILKFLARRGLVFRDGTNWCTPHLRWLHISRRTSRRWSRRIGSCFANIMRCSRTSCSGATSWIERSRGWRSYRRSRRR